MESESDVDSDSTIELKRPRTKGRDAYHDVSFIADQEIREQLGTPMSVSRYKAVLPTQLTLENTG